MLLGGRHNISGELRLSNGSALTFCPHGGPAFRCGLLILFVLLRRLAGGGRRPSEGYRYLYYNRMNLALKTTMLDRGASLPRDVVHVVNEMMHDFEESDRPSPTSLTPFSLRIALSLLVPFGPSNLLAAFLSFEIEPPRLGAQHQQLQQEVPHPSSLAILRVARNKDDVKEVFVRTKNDIWVVGRRSQQRELFMVFERQASPNLLEIDSSVLRCAVPPFSRCRAAAEDLGATRCPASPLRLLYSTSSL